MLPNSRASRMLTVQINRGLTCFSAILESLSPGGQFDPQETYLAAHRASSWRVRFGPDISPPPFRKRGSPKPSSINSLPASVQSGKIQQHRLAPGGGPDDDAALHRPAFPA